MLTSLELMRATGVSRATLNNYIAQGLISRPVVQKPTAQNHTRARQIGYFPQETLFRIQHIQQLKKTGKSMSEIARELQPEHLGSSDTVDIESDLPGRSPSDTAGCDALLGLLEQRYEVVRNLLKKRLPVLTEVAVLVADLQSSERICTELPPEEYFELINQIWATMEPIFRRYYGTHGKHAGDGMVYYFFPHPDCNYIFNALLCAHEIKAAMRKISKAWQLRKNWLNELYLNTGLNEGQEWLGVFHSETKVEFTVLGDTINHAARLSDYARNGTVWATKNLLGKLSSEERQRISYGIRRKNQEGQEILVYSSYSRIGELLDLSVPKHDGLRDIAVLPVTEIIDIKQQA